MFYQGTEGCSGTVGLLVGSFDHRAQHSCRGCLCPLQVHGRFYRFRIDDVDERWHDDLGLGVASDPQLALVHDWSHVPASARHRADTRRAQSA